MNATLIIYATLIFFSTIGLKRGEYKVNYLNNAEIIDMGVVAANNWCCGGCISFECYSCCSRVGSYIFQEGHKVYCLALANHIWYFYWSLSLNLCAIFCSNFSELFDTEWFITFLRNDVRIVKELPDMGGNFVATYTVRVPRKCTPKCYEDRVLPVLVRKRVSLHMHPQIKKAQVDMCFF